MRDRSRETRTGTRWLAACVMAALGASACVAPATPGVGLRAVDADIAFGLPEGGAVLPPNTLPDQPPLDIRDLQLPTLPDLPPYVAPEIPAALLPCTTDGTTTFPEEPAPFAVPDDRRPEEGVYLWKILGSAEVPGLPFKLSGGGQEFRAIRQLDEPVAGTYTYQTLQLNFLPPFGIVETTWRVRTENLGTLPVDIYIPSTEPPTIPSEIPTEFPYPEYETETVTVIGEPDRGIAISRIRYLDLELNEFGRFEPTVPLLILPLPVRVSERVNSTSVDPVTFQTVSFQGQVRPAERIDACSGVVEGWRVEGDFQVTNGTGSSVSERSWVFMPQFGGTLARETVSQTTTVQTEAGPVPAVIDLDSRLAQIVPLPLPEEFR